MKKQIERQFHEALRGRDAARLKELAGKHGIDEPVGGARETLLSGALGRRDWQSLRLLLEAGADPNHETAPLAAAAEAGHDEAVRLLLDAGAAPDQKGGLADFAALLLAANGRTKGHLGCVKALLAAGADPNRYEPDGDGTPLTFAAGDGSPEIIRELVAAGADMNFRPEFSGTPLMAAVLQDRPENVRVLLELGADPSLRLPEDPYGDDVAGKTALDVAEEEGNAGVAKLIRAALAGAPAPTPAPQTVGDAWKAVRRALKESGGTARAKLAKGASGEEVSELERRLGIALPGEIRESFLLCNGQKKNATPLASGPGEAEPSFALLSLDGLYEEWKTWTDLLEGRAFRGRAAQPEAGIRRVWWDRRWIPVASNRGGDCVFVDLAPAKGGRAGQVCHMSHEEGPGRVLRRTFAEWLYGLAEAIDGG